MKGTLTWRDLAAAVIAGGTVWIYYAIQAGMNIPLLNNTRWAVAAIALLGLGMYLLDTTEKDIQANQWFVVLALLGLVTAGLVIAGLITGNTVILLTLVMAVVAAWALETVRHATV